MDNLFIFGTASSASSLLPTAKATRSSISNQASHFKSRTLPGAFRGVQARRLWQGGMQGAAWGAFNDLTVVDWLKN